nr:hypothetical protein [Tanacetum cinerariifolium]
VAVKFDACKVFSLIPIKACGSGRGQLEITYLDEELSSKVYSKHFCIKESR